ncbi:hypothetical protein AbraIFM66951_000621 [Aspergillus brasiliensis]|uniref:Uncharacterized protein n=1 Tax=Aspergillus brasiliensis TaxID=319629 RepID=A0A9W6DUI9_9EURO|nr:hypothetical protein AbraCBS73388_007817 [Aspergillus brasiliensis]GKZ48546.1 hypothetical protein AbraIFM66951_000621 [Aspergillus brasiliensis]
MVVYKCTFCDRSFENQAPSTPACEIAYSGEAFSVQDMPKGIRTAVSPLMDQVRRMPNGYRELRSRSFIAEKNHGNAQLGHDLAVHCNIEMTHLGGFPPEIFQGFKDTL